MERNNRRWKGKEQQKMERKRKTEDGKERNYRRWKGKEQQKSKWVTNSVGGMTSKRKKEFVEEVGDARTNKEERREI